VGGRASSAFTLPSTLGRTVFYPDTVQNTFDATSRRPLPRPTILTGRGVHLSGVEHDITGLANAIGTDLATTALGCEMFAGHPRTTASRSKVNEVQNAYRNRSERERLALDNALHHQG
jgi:thiamine pyrophosphate-dependent acetolactate synthase large subunit-like protein